LSSASTAATLSSHVEMVLTADSRIMSATPAGSSLPIDVAASIWISICMPLLTSRIAVGGLLRPDSR
jgi:hypothetical protein